MDRPSEYVSRRQREQDHRSCHFCHVAWIKTSSISLYVKYYGNQFELGVPSERENVDKNVIRDIDGKMLWERF